MVYLYSPQASILKCLDVPVVVVWIAPVWSLLLAVAMKRQRYGKSMEKAINAKR